MDDWFTKEQTGFWGALASCALALRAFFKYKAVKAEKEMKMEKVGIKETKEVLDGLTDLGAFIIIKAKDGVSAADGIDLVTKIMTDAEFKGKLEAMISGINLVPAEIKDLDIAEGVELIKESYEGYKQIVEALKA